MNEDLITARALARALETLAAETKTAAACGRIALSALAQTSPSVRDHIGMALDAEVLARRGAGTASDLAAAAALAATRAALAPAISPAAVDEETLERVLIAAARVA